MREQSTRNLHIGTKKMRRFILLFFAALIIIADVLLILKHDRSFSANENRVLQQAPDFNMNTISSGKFMTQEEDFVTDQFFLRDGWIGLKLFVDKLTGKVESNGVYLGKKGYLLEKPVMPNDEFLTRNMEAITRFSQLTGMNVIMTAIPGAICVCDQLKPTNAPVIDETSIIARIKGQVGGNVTFVDVTGALKTHKEEELYYKSDHHWKSLGAKYAFDELAPYLGIEKPVSKYEVMTVTTDFTGTMGSNSGATYVKDSIEIYVPLVNVPESSALSPEERAMATTLEYVVEYVDSTEKSATIYKSEALEQKDKYQVFLGGNHPLIHIKTNEENGRHLLILKDSYANTFIQFLLPYYQTIDIVDPRYYSDNLSKLINEEDINETLILYSENNFITDNSLFGVLEEVGYEF